MTFEHQAGTFFSSLKDGDHIRRSRLHLFHNHVEAHFFQKVGEKKSHLFFTLTRASHARNPDQILRELDQLVSLDFFQHAIEFQGVTPSDDDTVTRRRGDWVNKFSVPAR
jgi:hypothetical protein